MGDGGGKLFNEFSFNLSRLKHSGNLLCTNINILIITALNVRKLVRFKKRT